MMMDWNEAEERPDWPEEFDEPVAQLGKPQAAYRTSRRKAFIKLLLGLGLIALGALLNYLYWWIFAGPIIPDKFFFLILFGTPIGGFILLYSSFRDRGMWVLVYPMGLLRWHRGEVISFPWDDISQINFHRINHCESLDTQLGEDGRIKSLIMNLEGASSKILGSYVVLHRSDGVTGYFPSALDEYVELMNQVQKETFQRLWPGIWEQYSAGNRVLFGDVEIAWAGIYRSDEFLPWLDFGGAKIANSKLIISKTGKWRSWIEVNIHDVPNPHLLLALLKLGQPIVPAVEGEKKSG